MKEELKRNQSASTCENAGRQRKHPARILQRVKIRESQTLQQDLTQHIRKIMSFSLADQFYKDLPQESKAKFQDDCFVNPKKIELSPGLSRIKQHYIQEYQKSFIVEGIQEIHNNQHAVQSILYSGLSASAQASAKWNSIQAMRRMQAERPQCPDFPEYPLDKRTFTEIQLTKGKTQMKKRAVSEHQGVNEKLILDRSHSLKKYLDSLEKSNKTFQEIYGQKKGEYDLILDYATKEKIDLRQADDDIQFINSRKVIKETKFIQNPVKRLQKKKYVDDDDIYGVRPNRIQPTRIILKDNNKSNQ